MTKEILILEFKEKVNMETNKKLVKKILKFRKITQLKCQIF